MAHETLDTIFRAYDIRGLYPSELNAEFYKNLGKAYVTLYNPKCVVVGFDMRPENLLLEAALVEGLTQMGCNVVKLGMIATEILYFAVGEFSDLYDGGFVITASHNGREWNGCKIVTRHANFVSGTTGLSLLKDIILKGEYSTYTGKAGTVISKDIYPAFKAKVLSFITATKTKPLSLIVDAGNGMGGHVFEYVFGDLPVKVQKMYFKPDGTYPNHVPNPMEESNIRELKSEVLKNKADFGIATDGDADRAYFVDKKGRSPSGAYTGVILAKYILANNLPNQSIVHDTRITWPFIKEATKISAKTYQSIAGRSFVKQKMIETNSIFGVEASSHYYYRDFYYCDSGMVTIAKFIDMFYHGFDLTAELDYFYNTYPNSGEINFKMSKRSIVLDKLEEFYSSKGAIVSKIDGLSVEFLDWRFNLRKSNTQNLLRLNIEATSLDLVLVKKKELCEFIGQEFVV